MRNLTVRFRILAIVVLVNLLGALAVMVYLHQSYSRGLDVAALRSMELSRTTLEALQKTGADELGSFTDPKGATTYAEAMKAVTGDDYAVMLDKSVTDQAAWKQAAEAAGVPDTWDEKDTYVEAASTSDELDTEAQMKTAAADIPETGRLVGIENGACSKTCHGNMKVQGDFWGVTWSENEKSQAHAVTPIVVGGKPIGIIYAIADISAQADNARSQLMSTLAMFGGTLLVATLLIGMMLDLLVFRRLNRMIVSMEDISVRVAGGDFDAHFEPGGADDEIGKFEAFFARFLDLVNLTLKSLSNK
ncbi:MAG TPA: hypothetical protein VF902_09525 [Coriobacteriia bacterium]